jgi:hypothetical protein
VGARIENQCGCNGGILVCCGSWQQKRTQKRATSVGAACCCCLIEPGRVVRGQQLQLQSSLSRRTVQEKKFIKRSLQDVGPRLRDLTHHSARLLATISFYLLAREPQHRTQATPSAPIGRRHERRTHPPAKML